MKAYRILQVHNSYQIPGGEDVVVRNEKRLLTEHGHEVYEYQRSNTELQGKGIVGKLLLPFSAVYSFRTAREVRRLIREKRIDLVHVHNTLTMVSPSVFYAAFRSHVPVVQTLHNFRMACPAGTFFRDNAICEECVSRGLFCAVRHRCYRGSRAQSLVSAAILYVHRKLGTYRRVHFICLSGFNRNKLLEAFERQGMKIDPARVYVKPNFTFAEDGAGEGLPKPQGAGSYFLFAGRLEPQKGIALAVRAFETLPGQQLYVAGDGPLKEELSAYVREHGMRNVTFLGYLSREEMRDRFCGAAAVLMPSQWYEPFGMTIAEAYSYGVPVIAGRIGNMGAMVEDGRTGLTFQYDSPEDLARKIVDFGKLDRQQLGENARRFYERNFAPESNYRSLMEIYGSILEKEREG